MPDWLGMRVMGLLRICSEGRTGRKDGLRGRGWSLATAPVVLTVIQYLSVAMVDFVPVRWLV